MNSKKIKNENFSRALQIEEFSFSDFPAGIYKIELKKKNWTDYGRRDEGKRYIVLLYV